MLGHAGHAPVGASRCFVPRLIYAMLAVACLLWGGLAAAQGEPTLKEVQQTLNEQGFDPGPRDGIMGKRTRAALRTYQESIGLPATGDPDRATIESLFPPSVPQPKLSAPPEAESEASRAENPPEVKTALPSPTPNQPTHPRPSQEKQINRQPEATSVWWWIGLAAFVYFFFRSKRRKKKLSSEASDATTEPVRRHKKEAAVTVTFDLDDMEGESTDILSRSTADHRSEGDRCWVPPGSTVEIAGHSISGGMIYVGDKLPDQDGYQNENCLIDPSLGVASSRADVSGELMNYWPSYDSMRASSRLALLNWLSGGRSNPNAYIGYVFIFFYGLERRLVLENVAEEAQQLIEEANRLRSLYGSNGSFNRYSSALIDAAAVVFGDVGLSDEPVFDRSGYEVPLRVKVAIARRIRDGEGISADWMLSWVLTDPETRLGTPARRDFEAFRTLFCKRFAARHPTGVQIKVSGKKGLRYTYRAASGTFEVSLDDHLKGLPDISRFSRPLAEARSLAMECTEALDHYSRFLGRRPEDRNSIEALSLLPQEIRSNRIVDLGEEILTWLHGVLSNGAVMPLEAVFARIRGNVPEKMTQRDVKLIADSLGRFGIGLSPDPRFAFKAPKPEDEIVLFRLPEPIDELGSSSDAYRATLLTLNLGMLIAQADGTVSPEEEASLAALISREPSLTDAERVRLEANIKWMRSTPLTLGRLRGRLKDARPEDRHRIGQIAISVAGADGRVDPSEVRLLEKLYTTLELDQSQLYGDLNNLGAIDPASPGDIGPVSVRHGDEGRDGYAIPKSPKPEELPTERVFILDRDRIAAKMADTAQVASVLSDVFVEEEVQEIEPEEELDQADRPFNGLDKQHGAFLSEVLVREGWTREEFEKLARSFDLMADGAMETLNEWALDIFDETVIEDGDTISIHRGILEMGT